MSKSISGHFKWTSGFLHFLFKDVLERIMPDGKKNIDFKTLPGSKGKEVKKRLTNAQMNFLTMEYGVEFAQVYILGPGKKGGGGKYYIYSGDFNSVQIPVNNHIILINHTHPGGTAAPSKSDLKLLALLGYAGSPQKKSSIIPLGKDAIKFTKNGKDNSYVYR